MVQVGNFRSLIHERRHDQAAKLAAARSDPTGAPGGKASKAVLPPLQKDCVALGAVQLCLKKHYGSKVPFLQLAPQAGAEYQEGYSRESFVLLLKQLAPGASPPIYYRVYNLLCLSKHGSVSFETLDHELEGVSSRVLGDLRKVLVLRHGSIKQAMAKLKVEATTKIYSNQLKDFIKPLMHVTTEEADVVFDALDELDDTFITKTTTLNALANVPTLYLLEELKNRLEETYGAIDSALKALKIGKNTEMSYDAFIDMMGVFHIEREAARRLYLSFDLTGKGVAKWNRIKLFLKASQPAQALETFRRKLLITHRSLRWAFKYMDTDKKRHVTKEEFDEELNRLDVPVKEAKFLFDMLTPDGRCVLYLEEFLKMMRVFSPASALSDFAVLVRRHFSSMEELLKSFYQLHMKSTSDSSQQINNLSSYIHDRYCNVTNTHPHEIYIHLTDNEGIGGGGGQFGVFDRLEFENWVLSTSFSSLVVKEELDVVFLLLDTKMDGKINVRQIIRAVFPESESELKPHRRVTTPLLLKKGHMLLQNDTKSMKIVIKKLKMDLACGLEGKRKRKTQRTETQRPPTPPQVREAIEKQKFIKALAEKSLTSTCPSLVDTGNISKKMKAKVRQYFMNSEKTLITLQDIKLDRRPLFPYVTAHTHTHPHTHKDTQTQT
eukprot:GHVR01005170.1.p1 GENE.GHVR01005170.1~~GHVR01005170.1.p1  ORF type:complete len:663 (+),score=132.81 GHVR01005170.1:89-2077(+)